MKLPILSDFGSELSRSSKGFNRATIRDVAQDCDAARGKAAVVDDGRELQIGDERPYVARLEQRHERIASPAFVREHLAQQRHRLLRSGVALGPLRLNGWMSIIVFIASASFFVWWQFLRRRQERRRPVPKGPAMAIPKRRVRPSR